jgi:outer membrane immunogenic protein
MKRVLLLVSVGLVALAVPASAADLRTRRPPPPAPAPVVVAPAFSWTGFYIGGHGGWAWAEKDWQFVGSGLSTSHQADGFLGGGQVGFNWQTGALVFGVEGQFSWADLEGSSACPNTAFTCQTHINWLATATGRIGYAAANWLFYVKGGAAWIDDEFTATSGGVVFSGSHRPVGWTAGGGVEYGLTPNWSAKIEYNYMDFGSERVGFVTPGGARDDFDVDQQVHLVKFGINYRFGAPAIAAPPPAPPIVSK